MLSNRVEEAFTGSVAHGAAMLPLPPLGLCQAQGQLMPMTLDSYSPTDYSDQYISDQSRRFPADFLPSNPEADLNSKSLTEAGPAVTVPADTQKNNQEQIAALVSSREREVNELQTTLAVPLAHFNAKFIWHCIMNIERDCEYVFLIHYLSTFILPEVKSPENMRRSRSRTATSFRRWLNHLNPLRLSASCCGSVCLG